MRRIEDEDARVGQYGLAWRDAFDPIHPDILGMGLPAVVVGDAGRKLSGAQPHILSRVDRGAHAPIRPTLPVKDGRTTSATPAVHRPRVAPSNDPGQHN